MRRTASGSSVFLKKWRKAIEKSDGGVRKTADAAVFYMVCRLTINRLFKGIKIQNTAKRRNPNLCGLRR